MRFNIAAGELLPWGWGVAWHQPALHGVVALPIPLNLVAGLIYRAWWVMKRGLAPDQVHSALALGNLREQQIRQVLDARDEDLKVLQSVHVSWRASQAALSAEIEQTDELKRQLAQEKAA